MKEVHVGATTVYVVSPVDDQLPLKSNQFFIVYCVPTASAAKEHDAVIEAGPGGFAFDPYTFPYCWSQTDPFLCIATPT
ncbi:MAG: hypothetical protein Q7R93_00605 [bacterium]|nr:hypothetical protein [bacterium]